MGILHRNTVGRTYVRELPKVTADQFWEWGPCWAASDVFRILKRYQRKRWTALEVLSLDEVEPKDRLWVVMRKPMLPVAVLVRIARELAATAMNSADWRDDRSWAGVLEPSLAACSAARSADAAADAAAAAHAAARAAYSAHALAAAARSAAYSARSAANAANAGVGGAHAADVLKLSACIALEAYRE